MAAGQVLLALKGHGDTVNGVCFSPDGRRVLTGSDDGTAKVGDALTGKELLSIELESGSVKSVALSPDGRRAVTGGDGTVQVWDADTGRQSLAAAHTEAVWGV